MPLHRYPLDIQSVARRVTYCPFCGITTKLYPVSQTDMTAFKFHCRACMNQFELKAWEL